MIHLRLHRILKIGYGRVRTDLKGKIMFVTVLKIHKSLKQTQHSNYCSFNCSTKIHPSLCMNKIKGDYCSSRALEQENLLSLKHNALVFGGKRDNKDSGDACLL